MKKAVLSSMWMALLTMTLVSLPARATGKQGTNTGLSVMTAPTAPAPKTTAGSTQAVLPGELSKKVNATKTPLSAPANARTSSRGAVTQ